MSLIAGPVRPVYAPAPKSTTVHDALPTLGRVVLAFLLAVVGGGISAAVGFSHKRLCGLISLAAGTLLGVTLFSIVPESVRLMTWWESVLALASGYVVFYVISRYVYHVCPACAASHFDETTTHRFSEIATALVIALAIHSTMDGLAMAAGRHGSHGLDLGIVIAVCVHKVPEGLALGALLLGAGYARRRAVAWVAAVEATTVLGGLLGLWLLPDAPAAGHAFWLGALLCHVGGGFIYLATHAVLGELVKHAKAVVLVNFALGVLVIAAVTFALGHS
ncbi:ZIP family metal transporter [bacterium]|nr:ZIP family metal transporter [bacterium]